MNEQEYINREIFAYYGRTMYLAQIIEKGLMDIILISQLKHGITKTRYDEIQSELAAWTFGQLKRKIKEIDHFTDNELDSIDKFHKKRDFLAHSYWWERTVEFYDDKLQYKLLKELDEYTEFFEQLKILIEDKIKLFFVENEIDIESIQNEMISHGKTVPFESFRVLTKNEIVIDIFGYKNAHNSLIPIFKLKDNTFWTICEIGLTKYKFEILADNIENLKILKSVFPINQFNPRPKVCNPWNYELDLKKNGLKMIISRDNNLIPMKWKITNTVANKVLQ